MLRSGIFNFCAFNVKVNAFIYNEKKTLQWNKNHDKVLFFFLLYIGECLVETINYYQIIDKRVLNKMSLFNIFDVILFSTDRKPPHEVSQCTKWPIIDHLIWLTWNRSVWPSKRGRHFGHSYCRRKIPILHHEINNVC